MAKRNFIRKPKRRRHGTSFWDHEYAAGGGNLALSTDPGEDLEKFTRWLGRQKNIESLHQGARVLDVGCGNGRNLVFLAQEFRIKGTGFDSSTAAIKEAKELGAALPLSFSVSSMAEPLLCADKSQDLVLDMMASHFLDEAGRTQLRNEIHRVLKPGGWLFLKTFLRDEDLHTERLLKDYPAKEANTYIHPVIGVPEHVYFESELLEFYEERFIVHKVYRSHQHRSKGKARKRRTISVYLQKDPYQ